MKVKIIFVSMIFCFGFVKAESNGQVRFSDQELVCQLKELISAEHGEVITEEAEETLLENLVMAGLAIGYVYAFKYVFENAHRTDYDAEEWMPYFDW